MDMVTQGALALIARRTGSSVLPDNKQWTNRLEIRSETSTRLYVVAQRRTDGSFGCSCMGWKRYRTCKHLDAIVPLLGSARTVRHPALKGD